ncbi:Conserved oligomeric Golgi complex subunit 2, partial [Trichostrongylus colubriformis]
MIELINDDYADFVHLSSNLVSLQSTIDKIENDMNTIWTEFESSTCEAVRTAERVESFCVELSQNRASQVEIRQRISFLSALQRLCNLINNVPESVGALWLEKVSSCLVDASSYKENLAEDSRESKMLSKLLTRLETVLCDEGVRSASEDCASLPHVLSLLSLANCTHSLTARLVSDLIYPKLVQPAKDHYEMLKEVFSGVNKMRANWNEILGPKYSGQVQAFLEQTLLTFLLTFIDKCMGTVAVPTNTSMFHRCFTKTQEFVENWPPHPHSRAMLKAIRDKFNLIVYFKLVTHKAVRQVDNEMAPESLNFSMNSELLEGGVVCNVSSTILRTVENVWGDDVFLYPITDKLWDFTLRLLGKHLAWARSLIDAATSDPSSELGGVESWRALLCVRHDLSTVASKVFDMALEQLWPKLTDLNVDTSLFGQCLTRFNLLVDAECGKIDDQVVKLVSASLAKEFDCVSDVPKQYRWTKKPSPSTPSSYIFAAHTKFDDFVKELSKRNQPKADQLARSALTASYIRLVTKAGEVLDSVDATGSSLSRFKRKAGTLDGTSDDDKIRTQIYRDLSFCEAKGSEMNIVVEGMSKLIQRSRPESSETNPNGNVRETTPVPSENPEPSITEEVTETAPDISELDENLNPSDQKAKSCGPKPEQQGDTTSADPSALAYWVDMAATWADIQRLVSDLQRVQLSQSSKKLSEANCVEVVSKLIQRSLINVVFTRDGHSYITQKHLATEVDDKIRGRLAEIAAAQQNAAAQSQKKSLAQLQQRTQGLYSSICMFELASSSFPDSLRDELRQYLLRTMGTDLANAALSCASGTENAGQLKEKQREETIASLPSALRDSISSLYSSLRGDDIDAFHSAVFDLSSPAALSISLKQPDAKTRAEVLESYVAELKEQVVGQTEAAAVLLSCVLYLLAKHGKPVTASGRFVAQLVPQLDGIVEQTLYDRLVTVQRLVVKCLKN